MEKERLTGRLMQGAKTFSRGPLSGDTV
jgi:hypothetical protein